MIPSDDLLKSAKTWKAMLKIDKTTQKAQEVGDYIIIENLSNEELKWLHNFFLADGWDEQRRKFIYNESSSGDFAALVEYMFDYIEKNS